LRVFLYAPTEDKVRRVVARGKGEAEGRELVETLDRDRADFIRKYFHVEWPTRCLYHIMLNTSVGEESVVRSILNLKNIMDSRSAE